MDTLTSAVIGLIFLGLGLANTVLMFKLWGYPFDEETHKSDAPRSLMLVHRLVGYLYLAIYLFMMSQMVPRLWTYQVELPARTVMHMTLGMTIGIILFIKILIVKYFKYLEGKMVPFLGTLLLICTFLLIGLSAPFAFAELALARGVAAGTTLESDHLERLEKLLPAAGLPEDAPLAEIASPDGLREGREALLTRCVQCHDLRTILVTPRTPDRWVQTVARMAERSRLLDPIEAEAQWRISAYLIAISPELQVSAKQRRGEELARTRAQTVEIAVPPEEARPEPADLAASRGMFDELCGLCHETTEVDNAPPRTAEEVRTLVTRMVDNGLQASEAELDQVVLYLTETYVR